MNKFEDVAARIRDLLTGLGIDPLPAIHLPHADDVCDVTTPAEIRLKVDKGPEDVDYYARHVVGHYLGDLHAFSDAWADRVADLWALQLMHNYCPGYDQAVVEFSWCVDKILSAQDQGEGSCREPWETQRRRLIALRQAVGAAEARELKALADVDELRAEVDELRAEVDELRRFLGRAIDVIVDGHAFEREAWQRACLVSGRYVDKCLNHDFDGERK